MQTQPGSRIVKRILEDTIQAGEMYFVDLSDSQNKTCAKFDLYSSRDQIFITTKNIIQMIPGFGSHGNYVIITRQTHWCCQQKRNPSAWKQSQTQFLFCHVAFDETFLLDLMRYLLRGWAKPMWNLNTNQPRTEFPQRWAFEDSSCSASERNI